MQAALHLLGFWAACFVTLFLALVLLSIYDGIIGGDLTLKSARTEGIIAAIASLIEGVSLWLVVTYIPSAARALLLPAIIVALIYKAGHLEDWSRYNVFMLLVFQGVLIGIGAALHCGEFQLALMVLLGFAFALGLAAAFMRGL